MLDPEPSSEYPSRLSDDDAYLLVRGTWVPRSVRSTRIELRANLMVSEESRRAVDQHLGGVVEERVLGDLRLLTSELVTNAFVHGECENGMVVLHLAAAERCVRVEVCDGGSGFSLSWEPRFGAGGFGLRLLDVLSSRWGVAGDSGTCVWFEIDLP